MCKKKKKRKTDKSKVVTVLFLRFSGVVPMIPSEMQTDRLDSVRKSNVVAVREKTKKKCDKEKKKNQQNNDNPLW